MKQGWHAIDLTPGTQEAILLIEGTNKKRIFRGIEKGRVETPRLPTGAHTLRERLSDGWQERYYTVDADEPVCRVTALERRVSALEEAMAGLQSPKTTNLERAIQEQRARAEAAESKLAQAQYQEPEAAEEPPEAIADLFQADRPYAEQAKALWTRYNELTNKIMLKVATEAEIRKHEKLQGELDWIKRHAFEGV